MLNLSIAAFKLLKWGKTDKQKKKPINIQLHNAFREPRVEILHTYICWMLSLMSLAWTGHSHVWTLQTADVADVPIHQLATSIYFSCTSVINHTAIPHTPTSNVLDQAGGLYTEVDLQRLRCSSAASGTIAKRHQSLQLFLKFSCDYALWSDTKYNTLASKHFFFPCNASVHKNTVTKTASFYTIKQGFVFLLLLISTGTKETPTFLSINTRFFQCALMPLEDILNFYFFYLLFRSTWTWANNPLLWTF